jgi:hypothetical protein
MTDRLLELLSREAPPLPAWLDDDGPALSIRAERLPAWLEDALASVRVDDTVATSALPEERSLPGAAPLSPVPIELPELPSLPRPIPVAQPGVERAATFRTAPPKRVLRLSRLWRVVAPIRDFRIRSLWGVARSAGAVGAGVALLVLAQAVTSVEVSPSLSDDVVRAYSVVDRLAAGSVALVVVDATGGDAEALAPVAELVVRHAMSRGLQPVVGWTSAPIPSVNLLVGSNGELGPLGSDIESIRRLGQRNAGGPVDPDLRRATGGKPIALAVVVAGNTGDAAKWLSSLRATSNPPGVAIVSGGDAALLAPVRGAGQAHAVIRSEDLDGYATLAGAGPNPWSGGGALQPVASIAAATVGIWMALRLGSNSSRSNAARREPGEDSW